MTRVHRITHPRFGVVAWHELRAKVNAIRKAENRKACWWCGGPVPGKCRTNCGGKECGEKIRRLCYWADTAAFVLSRDNHTCMLCGRRGWDKRDGESEYVHYEVDHIIPVSLGGSGDPENLRTLCLYCHKRETKRLRQLGPAYIAEVRAEVAA